MFWREGRPPICKKSSAGPSLNTISHTPLNSQAIDDFLGQGNMSYIVRAHEAHSEGVALSKGAKVFTVFSTSKVSMGRFLL
jgi:hypothetical protein